MIKLLKGKEYPAERIILKENDSIPTARPTEDLVERIINTLDNSGDDLRNFASKLLIKIAREKEILQGLFFLFDGKSTLNFLSGYACNKENIENTSFELGEGLPGQVAHDRKLINLRNVPNGYILIQTGLGQASPNSLIVFPVNHEDKLLGVIELASFQTFTDDDETLFIELSKKIGEQLSWFLNIESSRNGK